MVALLLTGAITCATNNNASSILLNDDNSSNVTGRFTDLYNPIIGFGKMATSITLTANADEVELNDTIRVSGILTGMIRPGGITLHVQVVCPDGTIASPIQGPSIITDSRGRFNIDFVPTIIGTHTVEVYYDGSARYEGCSSSITFEGFEEVPPVKASSMLTLTLSSSSPKVGETVEITGVLNGSTFTGPVAIIGAIIELTITGPDDNMTSLSAVTDENGRVTHIYSVGQEGTYLINANFYGDEGHDACFNNIVMTAMKSSELPVRIEWGLNGCPDPAYTNQDNTFTAVISISDDGGVTWRHTSYTQLFFTFTSTSGGTNYEANGWTPKYPAALTGACSVNFSPVDADIGDYIVTVYYNKVEGYQAASISATIKVEKGTPPIIKSPSSISLTLASASVSTGTTMHANGVLTNGLGIVGATVKLQVVLPDGSVVEPMNGATTVTGANGGFSIDYKPTVPGTYRFIAVYEGDTYNEASSKNVTFTATAPAAPTTLNHYYTVSSTGVVKDSTGTTVYTGTARQAIVWAQSNCPSGKSIGLLAGTFNIDSYLYVYRSLYGEGVEKTILKAATGLSVSPSMVYIRTPSGYGVTGITIKDIQFDGNSISNSAKTYGCIEPMGASYCKLVNLYIHDFPKGFGIETRGCHHMTIENCEVGRIGSTVSGMWANGICVGGDIMTIGSTTYSSSYNTIRNCTVYDCSMVGYNCEPGDHNLFVNCSYTESTGFAPYWMSGSTKIYNRAVTVFTWGESTRNAGHPSDYNTFRYCYFAKPGIIVANYGDHTEFDHCTLVMTANSGEGNIVALAGVGSVNYGTQGSDYASIHDCTVYFKATSSGGRGIHLYMSDHCTLTNNKIVNTGVSGKGYGIENDGTYNTISGTSCTGTGGCVGS